MQSRLSSLRQGKLVLVRPSGRATCAVQPAILRLFLNYHTNRGVGTSEYAQPQTLQPKDKLCSQTNQYEKNPVFFRETENDVSQKLRATLGTNGGGLVNQYKEARIMLQHPSTVRNPVVLRARSGQFNNTRRSPPSLLAEYLDQDSVDKQRVFIRGVARYLNPQRLPTILLAYMHIQANRMNSPEDQLIQTQLDRSSTYMEQKGYTNVHLAHWSWILSGATTDERVERYFSQPAYKPPFILAEILRGDMYHVKSLQQILASLLSPDNEQASQYKPGGDEELNSSLVSLNLVEDNLFVVLTSRLLYQARRIWPSAVISVAHLVIDRIRAITIPSTNKHNCPRSTRRVTKLVNHVIRMLSIPTSLNPMTSSRHIWTAQKAMLEVAGSFHPPLLLSQNSYRAVMSTLMASKKTVSESKSAILRTKSWPPWRRDQDGMDAKRSAEDDFSRVLSAISKMQEAGFRTDSNDEAARIYGGMESDGTPTIQTRRIMRRSHSPAHHTDLSYQTWTGRIEATRDVQEAWGAFLEFKRREGIPSQSMFLAMFEKLNFHDSNRGRNQESHFIPGDGKEVMPTSNANFTKYYIERHQPPPLSILYAEMLHTGIRPTGRCLAFLVSKARSSDEGIAYLLDSGIERSVLERLFDPTLHEGSEKFSRIPDKILCAYVQLICRLAPRRTTTTSPPSTSTSQLAKTPMSSPAIGRSVDTSLFKTRSSQENDQIRGKYTKSRETFSHVAYLLKSSSTKYRPTWYAYFRALAREGAIIPQKVVGGRTSNWDSIAWSRLVGALKSFQATGLELDPQGFLYLCMGSEKFATESRIDDLPLRQLGPARNKSRHEYIVEGIEIVKDEFRKLSLSQVTSPRVPELLHNIRGVHLHAYIRALGASQDHEAIVAVVRWMVEHNQELEAIAEETRSGYSSFGKVLVAICHFLDGTIHSQEAKQQVESVDWWGQWPSKEEVAAYLHMGSDDVQAGEETMAQDGERLSAHDSWLD